jgi:hypothetical protein
MTPEPDPHAPQDPASVPQHGPAVPPSGPDPGPAAQAAGPAGPPPAGPPGPPPAAQPAAAWTAPPYAPLPTGPSAPVGWVVAAMILFWPTGIPALLASHRAARAVGAGDVATAVQESATARRWSIVSVCVAAGLVVLSVLISLAWVILAALAVQHLEHGGTWDDGPGWSERSAPPLPFDAPGGTDLQRRDGSMS